MSEIKGPQRAAERFTELAEKTAHEGHDGYGSDDRAGYAGIAQVYATLALAAEVRALQVALVGKPQ